MKENRKHGNWCKLLIAIMLFIVLVILLYRSNKFKMFLGKTGINVYNQNISNEITELCKDDENTFKNKVTIDVSKKENSISPYIYGINSIDASLKNVKVNAIRQGGNRLSTYNWENNCSNAGNDASNTSDSYLSNSKIPGQIVLDLSQKSIENNIKYKFTTLQMMGYVAADKNGEVSEKQKAPSSRWKKVEIRKNGELLLNPDTNDDVVYMDEYVNYIISKLGDSTTATGIQGYSLDNEPALWNNTHSLAHSSSVKMNELISKSIELAKVVKDADANADVLGPALYGIPAYASLDNEENKNEGDDENWSRIKSDNGYDWFIDYYLDEMKKASDEYGSRLLDYMDIHYYSEACDVPSKLLQASRTLYDSSFKENSWINSKYQNILPILPKLQESIDKYFPGTKIAISEYNFRKSGNTIYEGIAEVQYLIAFAKNNVGLATYWGSYSPYIYSAINMFTDCAEFGEIGENIINSETEDNAKVCTLATQNNNEDKLDIILTNNDMEKTAQINVSIENSQKKYKKAYIYGITKSNNEIVTFGTISNFKNNEFEISIPSLSACRIILSE